MKPKRVDPTKVIQLIGILNAAIWLGGAVFFTFIAGPAFFSPDLEPILPKPENGIAARYLIGKFAAFQIACASIAVINLIVGCNWKAYSNPKPQALILAAIILLTGAGMFFLTPKMDALHQLKYADYFGLQATDEKKDAASRAFGQMHGLLQVGNLLVLVGLLLNFVLCWKTASEPRQTEAN